MGLNMNDKGLVVFSLSHYSVNFRNIRKKTDPIRAGMILIFLLSKDLILHHLGIVDFLFKAYLL